jgi:hypothetical protein
LDDVGVTSDGDPGGDVLAAEGGAGGGNESGHGEGDAGVDAHGFAGDSNEVGESVRFSECDGFGETAFGVGLVDFCLESFVNLGVLQHVVKD